MDELQELKDNNIEDFDKAVAFALKAPASPGMKMLVEKVYSIFRSLAVDGNNLNAHVRAQADRIEQLERESNNLINTVESLTEGMNAHFAMIAKLEGMTAHFRELGRDLTKHIHTAGIEGEPGRESVIAGLPDTIRPRGYDPAKSCEDSEPGCDSTCANNVIPGLPCDKLKHGYSCWRNKIGKPAAQPALPKLTCPDCKQDEADKTPSLACKGCEGQPRLKKGEVVYLPGILLRYAEKDRAVLQARDKYGSVEIFTCPDDLITVPPQDALKEAVRLLRRAFNVAPYDTETEQFLKKYGGSHD